MNTLADVRAAAKRLVKVDLRGFSNQHELNATESLRNFFGTKESKTQAIEWHRIVDDAVSPSVRGFVTVYDARLRSVTRTGRTEWRIYYSGEPLNDTSPGDWVFFIDIDRTLHGVVAGHDSKWVPILASGLNIERVGRNLTTCPTTKITERKRAALDEFLASLGAVPSLISPNISRRAAAERAAQLKKDGTEFPPTKRMAHLARELSPTIDDPDQQLLQWLETETQLFLEIERVSIQALMDIGFSSVETFLKHAKAITQRRSSRRGKSLELHLAEIFVRAELDFDQQKHTEGKKRPDFIFPGIDQYHDASFPDSALRMLAAKSTCKDRWPQILSEARRIRRKHLATLEAPISEEQTSAMRGEEVQLVVPRPLHVKFSLQQRRQIWDLARFIRDVQEAT